MLTAQTQLMTNDSSDSVPEKIPQDAVPFTFDSHLYILARIADTIPVSLIYDTGADVFLLDKDYMNQSEFGKIPHNTIPTINRGVGNSLGKLSTMIMDSIDIKIGNIKYCNKPTPIINLREIVGRYADGIIGNNAFHGKILVINFSEHYLLPIESLTDEMLEGFTELKSNFEDNKIEVECELKIDSVQTIKGLFLLDLGSGSTIVLTNEVRERLNLNDKSKAFKYSLNMGIGGDGSEVTFRSDAIIFLDTLYNVVTFASQNNKGALSYADYLGLIGNEILEHYDLIIDFPNKTLYAKRNDNKSTNYQKSSIMHMRYIDRTDICDGWIVSSLYENGIVQQAGIEIGDVIISINERPVKAISREDQCKGLGLKGENTFVIRKANGEFATYILNIDKEILDK